MKTTGKFPANLATIYRVLILAALLLALARYGHAHLPHPDMCHSYPCTPVITPAATSPEHPQPSAETSPPDRPDTPDSNSAPATTPNKAKV